MKKLLVLLIMLLILPIGNIKAKDDVNLYLFYGDGCPHCAEEKVYLESIKNDYSNLNIIMYEVWDNDDNKKLYELVKEKMNIKERGVPLTIIGTNYMVGFAEFKKEDLKTMIDNNINILSEDAVNGVINNNDISNLKFTTINPDGIVNLPIIGKVDIRSVSLPIVAVVLGLVDGFNPCAMWVLIFLITMLINMKNKKKAYILGITFLVTSALIYLLFMASWLNIASSAISVTWLRILIGVVALLASLFNIYKYIKKRNDDGGCEVVTDKKRSNIIDKVKTIVSTKSFIIALVGIVLLAITVNLIELACSLGLPLMFTQILAFNNINGVMTFIYMLVYILFFLIDDLIIFIIAMVTFKITGISTKYTKYSHLIGGLIMFVISILLIFKPEWIMFNFN